MFIMIVLIYYYAKKERREFDGQSNIIKGTITNIERISFFEKMLYIKTENGEEIKIIEKDVNKINNANVGSQIKIIKLEDNKYISDYNIRGMEKIDKCSIIIIGIMGMLYIWLKYK